MHPQLRIHRVLPDIFVLLGQRFLCPVLLALSLTPVAQRGVLRVHLATFAQLGLTFRCFVRRGTFALSQSIITRQSVLAPHFLVQLAHFWESQVQQQLGSANLAFLGPTAVARDWWSRVGIV